MVPPVVVRVVVHRRYTGGSPGVYSGAIAGCVGDDVRRDRQREIVADERW
jgi:hypothetical protein